MPAPPVQNFMDGSLPAVSAVWLNFVDEQVRLPANTLSNPVTIPQGGTGATDPATALASLGGTTLEVANAGALVVVEATVNQAYIGANLWPETAAESTAGTVPVNYAKWPSPWKDISRFVTDNTGATDVSVQIAAAVKAEKSVVFPEGTYLLDGAVPELFVRDGMHIEGATLDSTVLVMGPNSVAGKAVFNWDNNIGGAGYDCLIENMKILLQQPGKGQFGMKFWQRRFTHVERVKIWGLPQPHTVTFTGSVGGATSGTLTAAITNGVYNMVFPDNLAGVGNEVRAVTITGGTAAAWAGALASQSILTASYALDDATGIVDYGNATFSGAVAAIRYCYFSNLLLGIDHQGIETDVMDCQNVFYGTTGHATSTAIKTAPTCDGITITDNSFNIWNRCVYGQGTNLRQIGNRFENATPPWEWVRGAGNARIWAQSIGDEILGIGIPIFPINGTDLCTVMSGPGYNFWDDQQLVVELAQSAGWGTPTGAAISNNFAGASATLAQTSAAVAQLIATFKALGLYNT